jgi:ribose transport system permease protein
MGARPEEPMMSASTDNGAAQTAGRDLPVARFMRTYYIYIVLVAVVVVLSVVNLDRFGLFERGNFLNPNNIINILRVSAPLLTLAGAFTLLMVSGYIDLSVGSAMSLSAVVYALLAINGVPFLAAFALTALVGAGLGAINGFLVVRSACSRESRCCLSRTAFRRSSLSAT